MRISIRSFRDSDGLGPPGVHLGPGVRETIRRHVSIHPGREVGGVLVGHTAGARTTVSAVIPAFAAVSTVEALTVTSERWRAVARELELYPNERIVGWYRADRRGDPLLSGGALDIHRRYFSSPEQLALIVGRHGRESWFRWEHGTIIRLGGWRRRGASGPEAASRRASFARSLWTQRTACALTGIAIGSGAWFGFLRTSRSPSPPAAARRFTTARPVAHPIVVEPQAGEQSGSATSGR